MTSYPEWFESSPFKPEQCTQGDSNANILYQFVGVISSKWESIDQAHNHFLFEIMAVKGDSSNRGAALINQITLGKINGISARHTFSKELVSLIYKPDSVVAVEHRKFIKRLSKAAVIRNEIIHGVVSHRNFNQVDGGFFVNQSNGNKNANLKHHVLGNVKQLEYTSSMMRQVVTVMNQLLLDTIKLMELLSENKTNDQITYFWETE
ncbi:MAG: hypothetical protein KUG74_15525 [Rhodobacteraceae bacterium]|nr:hypothetical protein [Paracoccaceae bacterium]